MSETHNTALQSEMFHLAVNHQFATLSLDLTLVLAMGRVVLEHVDHVVQGNEGVIDGHNLQSKTPSLSCDDIIPPLTVAPFSTAALRTSRPIRPKPLMPILPAVMMSL